MTLKKKDVPTEYAPLEASVSVADWREGEAILWSGTNLAQKAEPEIVEITKSVTNDGGLSYDAATSVNSTAISTNAFKSSVGNRQMKLTIKVKTGATGANIECENLTAALGTIVNQSSPELTYDDDGNLYQEWTVSLNESAVKTAKNDSKPLVFKIYNQLDSEKQITLQLNPGIDPDDLQYGDIIYDDCTIVHLGEAKPVDKTAVGLVVFKSDTPTAVCETGVVNSNGETIVGKALVLALYDADSGNNASWGSDGVDEVNSLFPNLGNDVNAYKTDFRGYEKTKYLTSSVEDGGCGHGNHNAALRALNYHSFKYGDDEDVVQKAYLEGSTGWFLPSVGQWYYIAESAAVNGNSSGTNKYTGTFSIPFDSPSGITNAPSNLKELLTSRAGGASSRIIDSRYAKTSSESSANVAVEIHGYPNGFVWTLSENKSTSTNAIRAVLAY